jgi:hypothetical protein
MRTFFLPLLLALSLTSMDGAPLAYAQCSPGLALSYDQMLETPEDFIGCSIRIEGFLDSEDAGDGPVYTVRTGQGRSLEVRSWVPDGEGRSRYPSKIPDSFRTMAYFTGRRLALSGQLVRERTGSVVLEVSSVEVLDEGSE